MSIELNNSMVYLIYKITNSINGKFYIGAHQTVNIDDGYMGSGKALHAAYKKYGAENFTKEVILICSSAEEMYAVEKDLVQTNKINKKSYNLMEGGKGGFNYINDSGQNGTEKATARRLELFADPAWHAMWREKQHNGCIEKISMIPKEEFSRRGAQANATAKVRNGVYSFEGKQHSAEVKSLIGKKNAVNQKGSKNSRFGTMWITNGIDNKSIPKTSDIPYGWSKGRKMK